MSQERAIKFLEDNGLGDRVILLEDSTATVALAAEVLGVMEGEIGKSLTFHGDEGPMLILMAGDKKVNNRKFKDEFHYKAKMLSPKECSELVGHDVGGVCPFGINEGVTVYLDESLKDYETIYPACGSELAVAKMKVDELEDLVKAKGWVDISK